MTKTKATPQYQVWSTLRPGISAGKVIGGTVQAIQYGSTPLDPQGPLPEGTRLEQLHWMQPLIQKVKSATTTREVKGSKGAVYIVTTHPNGKVTCSCPGYTYRRTCKHLAP